MKIDRKNLYTILIIFFTILTLIFIFTAGTEKSPIRFFTDNRIYDILLAIICGAVVMFLSFSYSISTESNYFEEIIRLNFKKIKRLKEKGWSDEKIAEDLASAIAPKKGFRHNYIVRKFLLLLSSIDKIEEKKDE